MSPPVAMAWAASMTAARAMVSGWRDTRRGDGSSDVASRRVDVTAQPELIRQVLTRDHLASAVACCANASAPFVQVNRSVAPQFVERQVGEHERRPWMLRIAGAARPDDDAPRPADAAPAPPGGGTSAGRTTRLAPHQHGGHCADGTRIVAASATNANRTAQARRGAKTSEGAVAWQLGWTWRLTGSLRSDRTG